MPTEERGSAERQRQGPRLERLVRAAWQDSRGIRGLAEELGVSRATVYSWFKGLTSPDTASLARLARLLGTTPSELLTALEGTDQTALLDARIREVASQTAREVVESRTDTESRMFDHAAASWLAAPSAPALAVESASPAMKAVMPMRRLTSARLADVIGLREVESCVADDAVGPVRDRMYANDYSQLPVRDRSGWVGLITLETIARWMAARASRGLGFDDQTPVREVLAYTEDPDNFRLVRRGIPVAAVLALFDEASARGKPLMAVLVTAHGRPTGDLVGIVTPADLPGLQR